MVDIYQQWCGPCTGMVSNLKKIRNDIGDDLLKYAAVSCMRNVEPIKKWREKNSLFVDVEKFCVY